VREIEMSEVIPHRWRYYGCAGCW